MSDVFDLYREAFLFGLLTGVPFTLALQEAWAEFKSWRRQLAANRARLLRCKRTWECLDPDGHPGPCINFKDCD